MAGGRWTGGWVGHSVVKEVLKNIGTWIRNVDRPSPSLATVLFGHKCSLISDNEKENWRI
jgi:hypothetical protein